MPFVTLTTDFGNKDFYVGRFKGYLLSHNESIQLVDITHQVRNFDIIDGAFNIKNSFYSFPKGSIHIVRVNETGLEAQGLLLAQYRHHLFLTPDNGLLSLISENKYDWVRAIDFKKVDAFKSDEIYAVTLKSILNNTLENISFEKENIIKKAKWKVSTQDSIIEGHVAYVDKFGNIITNIHISDLMPYFDRFNAFDLKYSENFVIKEFSNHFHEVDRGEKLCRINDSGYLEIAMNEGPADKLFGIKFGNIVKIFFYDS
ncbi:MAG: SAM-dependent chlorinase/fluorinase [Chitinophagales bacterium]|nr:SAM-dependent chlorinase/fluorinase [Chitinophagales bacterium]